MDLYDCNRKRNENATTYNTIKNLLASQRKLRSSSLLKRWPKISGTSGQFQWNTQVFQDFVGGMYDEAKNEPRKLLVDAAVGAAVAAGSLVMTPEFLLGVTVVGVAAGAYELGKGLLHMAHEVQIIDNANNSPSQLEQAHSEIRNLGASSMDSLATLAGFGLTRAGLASISAESAGAFNKYFDSKITNAGVAAGAVGFASAK